MKKEVIGLLAVLIIIPSIIFAVLVLDGTTSYNSTDTNVTQETGFAHLNISDGNLVLYMPFDYNHTSGVVYDYSNNSNNGTMMNFTSNYTSSGKYSGALEFDGVDDYVDIADSDSLSYNGIQNKTISFWFKANEVSGTQTILSKWSTLNLEYLVYLSDSTLNSQILEANPAVTETGINADQWYHVVFIMNSTKGNILYVNGTLSGSTVDPGSVASTTSTFKLGQNQNNAWFNGSIDEVMIFNRALNSTEVLAIYSNQSTRFYPIGEMLFENNNFGDNRSVNISLNSCGTEKDAVLRAKINSGDWSNFSSCNVTDYVVVGSITSANLTLGFIAGNESTYFYSPFVGGNITLTSWNDTLAPRITVNSPTATTYTSSSVLFNVTATEGNSVGSCWYSLNSGTTNQTLTQDGSTSNYNYTQTSISNSAYTVSFWCNDTSGNLNNSMNVSFTVAVPATATTPETTSSGTGSKTYTASSSNLEEGYSVKLAKNQKVELNFGDFGKVVEVKLITSKKVVLEIDGEEYSFPKNSTLKLDLDSDGTYDLEIKNNNIIGRFADMEFKIIDEEVSSDEQEEQQENISEIIESVDWYVYLIVGVVIILIVVGIVLKKRRRND